MSRQKLNFDSQHPGTSPARSNQSVFHKEEARARTNSICSITDRHSTLKSKISAVMPTMHDQQIPGTAISPGELKKVDNNINIVLTPMEAEGNKKPGQYEFQNLLNSIFKESETPLGHHHGQLRPSDDFMMWAKLYNLT